MDNKSHNLECNIAVVLNKILVTPYNWSLLVITALWWLPVCCYGFWNTNFDMVSTITNYIMLLSVVCIAIGLLADKPQLFVLARLGVLTQLATMLVIVIAKSVVTSGIGHFVIPICMFGWLLLLKNIMTITMLKDCASKT